MSNENNSKTQDDVNVLKVQCEIKNAEIKTDTSGMWPRDIVRVAGNRSMQVEGC